MKKAATKLGWGILLCLIMATMMGHTDLGNLFKAPSGKWNYLSVNGESIRYLQKGTGADILFIHGTPGSIEDWTDIMDSLSVSYRVTAIDRLGHGYSTANHYQYHLRENADLVKTIATQLNLSDSLLIVGHSYGGATAAHLAANGDFAKAKWIWVDPVLYERKADFIYRLLAIPYLGKGIGFLATYTIAPSFIEHGVEESLMNISRKEEDEIIAKRKKIWLQPKVLQSRAKEIVNLKEDLKAIQNQYKTINADITILTGEDENRTLKKDCVRFHEEVPSSELVVYENTGHYVQFDRKMELLDIIRSKFERNKTEGIEYLEKEAKAN